jgi:hypothetical protein
MFGEPNAAARIGVVATVSLLAGAALPAAGEEGGSQVKPVIAEKLANVPGKEPHRRRRKLCARRQVGEAPPCG